MGQPQRASVRRARACLLALTILLLPVAGAQPATGEAVLRLGLLSDAQESGERPLLRAAVAELQAQDVEWLLYLGDTSYGYGGPPADWVDALGAYAEHGLLFVPGNHDDGRAYGEYMPTPAPPTWWAWERDGLLVVGLDTNKPLDAASPQLAWLRDTLAGRDADTVIVMGHMSWWTPNVHHDASDSFEGDADALRRLIAERDVEMVIAGHEHYYARTTLDGIPYVVMGAVEAQVREVPEEMKQEAWAQERVRGSLALTRGALTLEVKGEDGRVVDRAELKLDAPAPQEHPREAVLDELAWQAHGAPPADAPAPLPGEDESGRVLAVRYALVAVAAAVGLLVLYVAFTRRRSGTGSR